MGKLLSILLIMAVLWCLCACGGNTPEIQPSQTAATNAKPPKNEDSPVSGYGVVFQGISLVPGGSFAVEKLPQPQYSYTQGNDMFYNYTDLEVTAYNDGKVTVIRSVIVISPNFKTAEGLALGDDLEQVKVLYGSNYTQNGEEWLFYKGNTILAILTQDGFVAGIEYRLTEDNA